MHRSTVPNRELGHFSRSTARSTDLLLRSTRPVDRYAVHVSVHFGRPDRPTEPLLLLTVDRASRPCACAAADFWFSFFFPSSTFSTTSSPNNLHLGEDFSNLSRSPTYPSLSPGEIDTRSRLARTGRNRHTISAKSTHDLGLESVVQLSTGKHRTCLPCTSP